jgi:cytochrome c oxidase subunit IV
MKESSFLLLLCSIYTGIFLAALMVMDRAKLALVFALVLSMLGMVVFKP